MDDEFAMVKVKKIRDWDGKPACKHYVSSCDFLILKPCGERDTCRWCGDDIYRNDNDLDPRPCYGCPVWEEEK